MLKGLRKKASILSLSSNPAPASTDPSNYNKVLKQVADFEIALKAMDYLLDDRTDEGVQLLKDSTAAHNASGTDQPSSIYVLALGVMEFIEATLGFEPELMDKAHKTLALSESQCLANSKYNSRYHLATSNIYPPGTEFQVTYAESTLLNALLMLLTENNGVIEGAKALFKLRKAYQTLDAIFTKVKESEKVFNENLERLKKEAAAAALNTPGASSSNISTADLPGFKLDTPSASSASLPQDLKLMKELEKVYQMRKSRIEGTNLGNHTISQVDLFQSLPPDSPTSGTYYSRSSSGVSSPSIMSGMSSSKVAQSVEASLLAPRPLSPRPPSQNSHFARDKLDEDEDDDDEFEDAFEDIPDPVKNPSFNGSTLNVPQPVSISNNISAQDLGLKNNFPSTASSLISTPTNSTNSGDNHLHVSTIDEFIHSGVQLCFGILQVVLSLIPPAIGMVLSIVGFKGDKEAGLKMLWRTAITSRNIHGELALLTLLIFYDGPIQFIDFGFQLPGHEDENVKEILNIELKATVSDQELAKILQNPGLYTPQILFKARKFFPHNALWILQEGRALASQGKLSKALQLMQSFTDSPTCSIQMKQIEALLVFDRAMFYAFYHDFEQAARDFIYLIDINSWSKGVYLFMAAGCYLEQYRMIKIGMVEVAPEEKEEQLKKYADLAKTYFDLAPTYVPGHGINASKKGGIGGSSKQMPFDKFVLRKLKHIEANQKRNPGVAFVDCIGTSIIHELVYFWNGYNRMTTRELEMSLKLLGYSGKPDAEYSLNTKTLNYAQIEESTDESMIRNYVQAIVLRSLKRPADGLAILDTEVIAKYVISDYPQFRFTKMTYSPYLYPTALSERSMFVWQLRTSAEGKLDVRQVVKECKNWLKKGEEVGAGDYELSNRTGFKIKAAVDRLDELAKHR